MREKWIKQAFKSKKKTKKSKLISLDKQLLLFLKKHVTNNNASNQIEIKLSLSLFFFVVSFLALYYNYICKKLIKKRLQIKAIFFSKKNSAQKVVSNLISIKF